MAVQQNKNGQKYTTSKTTAVSEYRRKNNREDVTDWDNGTRTSVYFPTDDELKDMNTTGNPSAGGGTSGRRNRSKKATETTGHTGYVTEPVTETRQPKPAKPEEEIDTQPGATGSQTPGATTKKNEPSSLTLRRGAETYGVDPNASYEGFDWYINAGKNAAARTGYDLWNLISFGALERQDTLTDQLDRGQISLDEYQEQSIVNFGVSGAQLGLTAATGAAGGALATAGVGTRVAAAGGITVAEKFAGESLEISTGFRREYSPWEQYALAGAFGSLFGAGGGKPTVTVTAGDSIAVAPGSRSLRVFQPTECFVAGTLVWTLFGQTQAIETIKVGDLVLSKDERSGEIGYKTVTAVFSHYAEEILDIVVAGQEEAPIGVTPTHPFRVHRARSRLTSEDSNEEDEATGWVKAQDIQAGDFVQQPSGEWVKVLKVSRRQSGARVYNFEVADFHTYFVGQNGVFVHNSCPRGLTQEQFDDYVLRYAERVDSDLRDCLEIQTEAGARRLSISRIMAK